MFLRAVAIYNSPNDTKPTKPTVLRRAQQEKSISLYSRSQLGDFETYTIPKLPNIFELDRIYKNCIDNEWHYVKKIPGDSFFMVLCSKGEITPHELHYLFINLRHAHVRPDFVNINNMVSNPLEFTGKDRHIVKIQEDIDSLQQTMTRNIDAALSNRDKIENLVSKTEQLQADSLKFNRQSKKLNRCCFN